jgi:diacylglycerol kinase family enzyme
MASTEPFERLRDTATLRAPGPRKRLLIIVNPYATTVSGHLAQLVVAALSATYDVEAVHTTARNHATELCREAAHQGYDLVVAFGGDGTVNEAANGLVGSDTPLTCLPGGSNSVFARMLGIPIDIVDATEHLLAMADRWSPRTIDVAYVNDRHFLFASGIGLDAAVVSRVDDNPKMKARFRQSYFAWSGVSTFTRSYLVKAPELRLALADGTVSDGATVVVQNGDPYTYFHGKPISVTAQNDLASGRLTGVMLHRTTATVAPGLVARMFSGRMSVADHRAVQGFETGEPFTVTSVDGRFIPIHVDGDHIGDYEEARYGIRPGALRVIA